MQQKQVPQLSAQPQLGETAQKHELKKPYAKPELTNFGPIATSTALRIS